MTNTIYELVRQSRWDFYDINWTDDGSFGALASGTPTNELIPYPYEADDPDEAISVKAMELYASHNAYLGMLGTGDLVGEHVEQSLFFFKPEETDESTEAYRDEMKQSIARMGIGYQNWNDDTTNGPGSPMTPTGFRPGAEGMFRDVVLLKEAQIFPLNMACKNFRVLQGAAEDDNYVDASNNPDHLNNRFAYRVVRNPMGALGRILALINQSLAL